MRCWQILLFPRSDWDSQYLVNFLTDCILHHAAFAVDPSLLPYALSRTLFEIGELINIKLWKLTGEVETATRHAWRVTNEATAEHMPRLTPLSELNIQVAQSRGLQAHLTRLHSDLQRWLQLLTKEVKDSLQHDIQSKQEARYVMQQIVSLLANRVRGMRGVITEHGYRAQIQQDTVSTDKTLFKDRPRASGHR